MEKMDNKNVKETIKIFELQVDEQMLPQGRNPIGLGDLLTSSNKGLSREDVPKLILGRVQPQLHEREHGTKAEMEKRNLHKRAYGKDAFGRHGDPGPSSQNLSAKNRAKFNPKTLKIVRDELDNLMRVSEGLERTNESGNSGTSTSTWASFAPIEEETPIEKIISGYAEMSDEDKVDALRMELPPFDENDAKYNNLKYALG